MMKSKKYWGLVVVLACVAFSCWSLADKEENENKDAPKRIMLLSEFDKYLELRIPANQPGIKMNKASTIRVEIKNISQETVSFVDFRGGRDYRFVFWDEKGQPVPFSDSGKKRLKSLERGWSNASRRALTLKGGESVTLQLRIETSWVFPKPGKYQLLALRKIRTSNNAEFIASNLTTVDVVEK